VRWWTAIAVVVLVLASVPGDAIAKSKPARNTVDPALLLDAQANPGKTFAVIVQSVPDSRKAGRSDRAGAAVKRSGGTPKHALPIVGAASATLTGRALINLAKDKDVAYISRDATLKATADVSDGVRLAQTPGIVEVGAPSAWSTYGVTGHGVGIAVVDSGVAPHPDLAGRIVAAIDFTSAAPTVSAVPLGDLGGHGTHVAGLAAGNGTASGGEYTGVAPQANIIDVRVIDANGSSNISTVLRGLQWVLANRATYNIRVVNLSLGAPAGQSYTVDPLATAAEILTFAGIAVVVAAGNSGPDAGTVSSPGYDPYVITVGAVDDNGTDLVTDDSIASFSSRGPTADGADKPDLVAPGRKMVSLRSAGSALDLLYPERQVTATGGTSADYFRLSGTSMAAPVVAGAIALMLERNPTLSPEQVKYRLRSTATPMPAPAVGQGAGMLDAAAAVGSVDTSEEYSDLRVSDAFAAEMYAYLVGQPLVWRDPTYDGGVDSNGIPWANVTWENVTWDNVTWENVTWESFTWMNVTWDTVSAESVSWEAAEPLATGTLGSSRSGGWDLVN
jgi:serine protease AprX